MIRRQVQPLRDTRQSCLQPTRLTRAGPPCQPGLQTGLTSTCTRVSCAAGFCPQSQAVTRISYWCCLSQLSFSVFLTLPEDTETLKIISDQVNHVAVLQNPFCPPPAFTRIKCPLFLSLYKSQGTQGAWLPHVACLSLSGRVLGTAGWSHSSCGTELAGNSVHTSGTQLVVLSMGLSEYHPKLRPHGYVPDYRVSCAHVTGNLWEKDGIQELLNMYLFFNIWALCQEYALPLLTLFCYQIGSKINKRRRVTLPWWQRHFSSPREIRYCF